MTITATAAPDQLVYLGVVERLVTEYDGLLPPGTVMRSVIQSRNDLDGCGFSGLAAAVEQLARRRLANVVDVET